MAKIAFIEKRFQNESQALIARCNLIIEGYLQQGFRLTLRQLYYQLVTQNAVPNTERSYKKVGSLLSDARLAGLVDWDAIEDRVRVPWKPSEFDDLADLAEAALRSYRLPRWEGQEYYVELWVEKDALAGVLRPLASEFHVTQMVNRGYSSQSAMYEAAVRFGRAKRDGRKRVLLYLGDHDPSGEDMVRDVRDRLTVFGVEVEVRKVALTMAQVEEYHPPPNPAKTTDSRYERYAAQHGDESWEVDALPPDVLQRLIREAFEGLVDHELMDSVKAREERDKARLRDAVGALDEEDDGGEA